MDTREHVSVAHIEIVDQTLRDGQQSLWGMRMRVGQLAAVAQDIDEAGYRVVDLTGSSIFECMMRYNREDPWEGLDIWRSWMPNSRLRAGSRSNCIAKFGLTPDSLMDLWIQTLGKHGIDSFWIYDCLYNMDKMERLCRTAAAQGCEIAPAIMYGISPVHTDEWFAARVGEMVGWGIVDAIYFEDAAGILTPERARTLLPALVAAAGDVPLELQCHNTTGLAPVNYLIGIDAGARILHTAVAPMANGPSVPSTEKMLENLRWSGHTTGIDGTRVERIAAHMERVARQEGFPVGVPNEYSVFPYFHQLPGGMTGTLKAQLAQHGMSDRLDEVLEEVVQVRADLGHPISATPFSQLVGIQAVLNIVTGERYSVVPDEVLVYVLGHLGQPPAALNPDVLDRMLATERGREMQRWTPPEPSVGEMKEQMGDPKMSDEELLNRYLVPEGDVRATHEAGPVARDYRIDDGDVPLTLVEQLLAASRVAYAHVEAGASAVTLHR
jgi:oxaloacetate decarboxylase (Na+ extruding) subunit alpha